MADHKNRLVCINCSSGPKFPRGKMSPQWFFPRFRRTLELAGVEVRHANFKDFVLADHDDDIPTAILLIYDEEHAPKVPRHWNAIRSFYDRLVAAGWQNRILHAPDLGEKIRNKKDLARTLRDTGHFVREIEGQISEGEAFSLVNTGAQKSTQVVPPGKSLDSERFNTPLIDTRHTYRGVQYYVALRAMAVGKICTGIHLRARPVAEGSPNVHAADTPADAELLNHLYGAIVLPKRGKILSLCESVSETLGVGFWGHDILPCTESGRLLMCETTFKFDNRVLRGRLGNLSELIFGSELGVASCDMSALAFCTEARRIGIFRY